MSGLNSRWFFLQWQIVYASSNPGHRKDHWVVDGVNWTKERHGYWGEHYSVQHEVHRLEFRGSNEWQLLVVTERWWGSDGQKCIRDTWWCKLISGRADKVRTWLRKQEARLSPSVAASEVSGHGSGESS